MKRCVLPLLIALVAGCLNEPNEPNEADSTEQAGEVEQAYKPPVCPITRTCPVPPNNGGYAWLYYEINSCSVSGDIACYWVTGFGWQTTYIDIQAGCEHCRPYGQPDEHCAEQYGPSQWTCSSQ